MELSSFHTDINKKNVFIARLLQKNCEKIIIFRKRVLILYVLYTVFYFYKNSSFYKNADFKSQPSPQYNALVVPFCPLQRH